ncbi:MAG: cyclic pyranopterin monophosphate synthase MoaC [Acidimicrobiia bacterium]|nr:cyclic pyranopterin monophosphate synthase MoaC [Acidimicrobiia bacterium]MDH3396538.1 cyclic pyranopterin monophosphate synthase MoaC [Acidimicrobiia bacterium]
MVDEEFSHLDEDGHVHMVDVGGKDTTDREATAEAHVVMDPSTRDRLFAGDLPKGDALAVARVAGIMAAKRTAELIPLCHPIAITAVSIDVRPAGHGASVRATVSTRDRTGVEMEAMTAASVAALTVYDMIKGVERGAHIADVRLVAKSGGRSGEWIR